MAVIPAQAGIQEVLARIGLAGGNFVLLFLDLAVR
jgi:hypothetical protein